MAFFNADYEGQFERTGWEARFAAGRRATNNGLDSIMDTFATRYNANMDVVEFRSNALGIMGEIVNGRPKTTGIIEPDKPKKPKPKTIRQKLQAEVDSWLNDIK